MQASAQPMHELENRNRLGLDDAFHHQLAGGIQYRDRDRVLVNIHSDILRAFHRRVLLSDGEIATAHSLVQGGTFLYCVAYHREVDSDDLALIVEEQASATIRTSPRWVNAHSMSLAKWPPSESEI